MTEVRFLSPVAKFIKKMIDQKLKTLYQEAVDKIYLYIPTTFLVEYQHGENLCVFYQYHYNIPESEIL